MKRLHWVILPASLLAVGFLALWIPRWIKVGTSNIADSPSFYERVQASVEMDSTSKDRNLQVENLVSHNLYESINNASNVQVSNQGDSGLGALNSYCSNLDMEFKDNAAGSVIWQLHVSIEFDRSTSANHIVFSGSGTSSTFGFDALEIIKSGEKQWARFGNGSWMSIPPDENLLLKFAFSPEEIVQLVNEPELIAQGESIGGVLADHYRFDEKASPSSKGGSVQGDYWTTQNGGYIVKFQMNQQNIKQSDGTEAQLEVLYAVKDINQPVTIQIPVNIEIIPLMSNATSIKTTNSFVSFTSATSLDKVSAFYQEQMPKRSWQLDDANTILLENLVMLTYRQGDRTVTIHIKSDGGMTVVLAFIE